ncbi:MAG: hypothetical protein RL260_4023 [Pseudomonadota bacterium]|jgi:DNA polymerase IIIc chi subunit
MHALTVTPFADLMPAPVAPAPSFVAHVLADGLPIAIDCADESELFAIAEHLNAFVLDLYLDGSMVLTQWPDSLTVAPGVYPLALAA